MTKVKQEPLMQAENGDENRVRRAVLIQGMRVVMGFGG